MSDLRKKFTITDASGTVATIDRYSYRRELIIRNDGDGRVWYAFNESAIEDEGSYIEAGEIANFSKLKGESDLYFVTNSGETATIYVQL
jgi:hypothetical protein